MRLFDAHCHPISKVDGIESRVLNGTHPNDWPRVIKLAGDNPGAIAAIGLHPMKLGEAAADWKAQFLQLIASADAVGEIGLDYREPSCEVDRQKEAFCWQLNQAAERDLPVSIHCVRALNDLLNLLKTEPLPNRGVHLHAFNGSAEQAAEFIKIGAYFSFNAEQLHPPAKKAPAALRLVPDDRLLIETDAEPSDDEAPDPLGLLKEGYQLVAKIRGIDPNALAAQVEGNFKRYFLND